jgi:hypothetical protein
MAAIEVIAVWIDVSAVELQAEAVTVQRPIELDHEAIITRRWVRQLNGVTLFSIVTSVPALTGTED